MSIKYLKIDNRIVFILSIFLLFFLTTHPAFASNTSGGGLPSDSWITKVSDSVTGPWAFGISVVGMVGAGAALIFGGSDINGFLRTLIFLVFVLSFIVAAKNSIAAITGQGAEITSFTSHQHLRSK
jgi:type IV secretory pathway VirB2 component (pilin)